MATVYLPIIARDDFDAFRRLLCASLPDTYDEWRHLLEDRSLQTVRGGHISRGIKVDPHEFAVWVAGAPGRESDLSALDRFASLSGSRADEE
jgi:hypothetical protein